MTDLPDEPDLPDDLGATEAPGSDLASLRDDFVDAFNERDLDGIADLVRGDVEVPEAPGTELGPDVLVDELQVRWQRSPQAIATRAQLDGTPSAVLWLPDRDGTWARSTVVLLDSDGDLLVLVALADDPDTLDQAETAAPTGNELAEWDDWREWNVGDDVAAEPGLDADDQPSTS